MVATKTRKKHSDSVQTERTTDITFRTPRELLFDYVTGKLANVARPMFVVSAIRPFKNGPRVWACTSGVDSMPDETKFVCSIVDFNRWALAHIGTWESADLKQLMRLWQHLENFLIDQLMANNADERWGDSDNDDVRDYDELYVDYEDPEPGSDS